MCRESNVKGKEEGDWLSWRRDNPINCNRIQPCRIGLSRTKSSIDSNRSLAWMMLQGATHFSPSPPQATQKSTKQNSTPTYNV